MVMLVAVLLAQAPEKVPGATFEKTNKPSGLMPEHQRIAVPGFGRLDIVSLAAWEKLFDVEPQTQQACVTRPAAALKAALEAKGLPRPDQELALLGCLDAAAPFAVQTQRVRVGKVDGFLYVTQLFIEEVLPSNEGLQVWFQGLSDDGQTYVVGSTRVRAKGLRDTGGELQKDSAAYRKAVADDVARLGRLKGGDFDPNLDALAAALKKARLP